MNDCSEIPLDLSQLIDKSFEFLKQYVKNVDKDVLYSLLLSEMDNPNRLETIMCDMLGIPNALDLVCQFQSLIHNLKRNAGGNVEIAEAVNSSEKYFEQISEMFPDVDRAFLKKECQRLESEKDCSRFINTVMLSGAYLKHDSESSGNSSANHDGSDIDIIAHSKRPVVVYSSDEEITSSGIVDNKNHKARKRKAPTKAQSLFQLPSTSKNFTEVEEIAAQPGPSKLSHVLDNARDIIQSVGNGVSSDSDEDQAVNSIIKNPVQNSSISGSESSFEEEASKFHSRSVNKQGKSNSTGNKNLIFHSSPKHDDTHQHGSNEFHPVGWIVEDIDSGSGSNSKKDEIIQIDDVDSGEVSTTSVNSPSPNNGNPDQDFRPPMDETLSEWVGEHTAELIRLFPETDPSYLRAECIKFNGSLSSLNEFVISKLENNNMPSRAEFEKRKEMEELQIRYTTNFSIEDFLKVIPDPWSYFKKKNRNCSAYKLHSLAYLKTRFRKLYSRVISSTLLKNNNNLYLTCLELEKKVVGRLSRRCDLECNAQRPTTINIHFLQEVAFIENEKKIKNFIEVREIDKRIKFEEAKKAGRLLECQCCFDTEVMVEDTVYCPNDHCFCKTCVIRYVEVGMGQAKCQFSCLADCGENYTLAALQSVLKPELFSKIIQANQMEEIKAAGIEDLVQCPFCNYATIMPPEVKIMSCLNPECQKESCRLCKELSHIPLKCDEVEKSEEVKIRTYIENKMTEALVRTCYKCGKGFVKVEGCNKMICCCGAMMCYICRKPVAGYSHFNGQGGNDYSKCPLYSTNDELHVDLVKKVAEEAKAEILKANPDRVLKHDPTMVLPERSYEQPVPGVDVGAALNAAVAAVMGRPRNPARRRVRVRGHPRGRYHPGRNAGAGARRRRGAAGAVGDRRA